MMIEKVTGRTLAGAKERTTTFEAAEVISLALAVGFAALCGGTLLLMLTII
jgi:hypothetical protein